MFEWLSQAGSWIVENEVRILAVLGLAYALARVFVKLTPTPKDDEALEGVSVFIRGLAAVFGLKIVTQQEKDERAAAKEDRKSGRASVEVLLVVALVVLALAGMGCASSGDAYQASSLAFVAAVDAATELRLAGKLSAEEVKAIDLGVKAGALTLSVWGQKLKRGESYDGGTAAVTSAVDLIRSHLARKE